MKKMILALVFVALCGVMPLFAEKSDYYYLNVPIEKIFLYKAGYIVVYRKGIHQMARTYLPMEWFSKVGGKGELIGLSHGKEWPSLTVYYKDGEFSHVRVKVRRETGHESWGVLPQTANLDEFFQDVEEVKLQF